MAAGGYLVDGLSVLLDGRLREHRHDLGGASVRDPDLGPIQDVLGAARGQHRARPANITHTFIIYLFK